ncbi:MAG: hypothetical protein AAGF78_01355 [Pseudomonadota bacterium]
MSEQIPVSDIAAAIAPRLVSVKSWGDASFLSLPMVYPSGSFVTVRLSHVSGGVRVSDSGFAYRELESFGVGRSFSRTARTVSERFDLSVGKRSIYVDVPNEQVERAILEVGSASRDVADQIISRAIKDAEADISEFLQEKLSRVFPDLVDFDSKVVGASSTEWEVSASTNVDGLRTVFQAVSNYPVAVYKASTAFHDIAALDTPPKLVSVVASKSEMGSNLSLLSQAGNVVEIGLDDALLRDLAA